MLYGYGKQSLRSHFENKHTIPMKWENRNFKSITDFQTIMEVICRKRNEACLRIALLFQISNSVYECHRSGWYGKKTHDKR